MQAALEAQRNSYLSEGMVGKLLNSGQACITPDYLMVPEEQLDEVIHQATIAVKAMYPSLLNNEQYTAVINDRHYQRLTGYLADAHERSIRTVAINVRAINCA